MSRLGGASRPKLAITSADESKTPAPADASKLKVTAPPTAGREIWFPTALKPMLPSGNCPFVRLGNSPSDSIAATTSASVVPVIEIDWPFPGPSRGKLLLNCATIVKAPVQKSAIGCRNLSSTNLNVDTRNQTFRMIHV